MQRQTRWVLPITVVIRSGLKLPGQNLLKKQEFPILTWKNRGLECKYKKAAFYEDQLQIHVTLTRLTPVRLEFSYKVTREDELIATGKTSHGMVGKDMKPVNVKKEHPEIYRMFEAVL